MTNQNSISFLLISIFSSLELILIQASSAYALDSYTSPNNISDITIKKHSELDTTNQKKIMLADGQNGLCEGKFKHPTGDVTFNTNPNSGKLDFGFQLSPGSILILGDTVSGYMLQAIVQDYKINPPYGPHLNKPSNYDFHGSIFGYNRLGSKSSFRLQTGNKVLFTWLITGVGARSKASVLRAVECKAV